MYTYIQYIRPAFGVRRRTTYPSPVVVAQSAPSQAIKMFVGVGKIIRPQNKPFKLTMNAALHISRLITTFFEEE